MNHYVRTEDGRIFDITGKRLADTYYDMGPDDVCIGNACGESDDIEHLFDYIVSYRTEGTDRRIDAVFHNMDAAVGYYGNSLPLYDYYGAIDVGNGLTYPAKMNKRNWEFELI